MLGRRWLLISLLQAITPLNIIISLALYSFGIHIIHINLRVIYLVVSRCHNRFVEMMSWFLLFRYATLFNASIDRLNISTLITSINIKLIIINRTFLLSILILILLLFNRNFFKSLIIESRLWAQSLVVLSLNLHGWISSISYLLLFISN